ncbi:MAG: S-layer homology domain-containing protein, partial [Defluviitaleaceae bacterium]|nr:S-layer homology domain-containing protein [Defluviitaleaceae bacterium]
AGKKAQFYDFRPLSLLEGAGLPGWQSHIAGDSGTIEADPALGVDFLPANPLCAGMGLTVSFTTLPPIVSLPAATTPPASGQQSQTNPPPANTPSISNFRKIRTYTPGQFTDVNENEWYGYNRGKSVATAYEYGLMQGVDQTSFNPAGAMTVAEALALASRVRSIYSGGTGEFTLGRVWYQVYVDYAVKNGIVNQGDFENYGRAATRAEMAYIFSRALPAAEYKPQNTVDSLPDVHSATPHAAAVYMLYRAGVLTGNDESGTFNPNNGITRAEAATIINRVIIPATRASGRKFG